jgi:hypothetical protein
MSSTNPDPEIIEKLFPKTSQWMVDVIYDTLSTIHQLFIKAGINYTIFGGTMLGSKRHGGLIPWDDDADVAIHISDKIKLLTLTKEFEDRGFLLSIEPLFGYRVWDCERTVFQSRYQLQVPFVDIFLIDNDSYQYYYTTDVAKEMFPEEPLPYGCFQRLIDVPFGHLTLRGLNDDDVEQYLKVNYGKDWNHVAWRDYDHLTGQILPRIPITLEQFYLSHPALHSQYHQKLSST